MRCGVQQTVAWFSTVPHLIKMFLGNVMLGDLIGALVQTWCNVEISSLILLGALVQAWVSSDANGRSRWVRCPENWLHPRSSVLGRCLLGVIGLVRWVETGRETYLGSTGLFLNQRSGFFYKQLVKQQFSLLVALFEVALAVGLQHVVVCGYLILARLVGRRQLVRGHLLVSLKQFGDLVLKVGGLRRRRSRRSRSLAGLAVFFCHFMIHQELQDLPLNAVLLVWRGHGVFSLRFPHSLLRVVFDHVGRLEHQLLLQSFVLIRAKSQNLFQVVRVSPQPVRRRLLKVGGAQWRVEGLFSRTRPRGVLVVGPIKVEGWGCRVHPLHGGRGVEATRVALDSGRRARLPLPPVLPAVLLQLLPLLVLALKQHLQLKTLRGRGLQGLLLPLRLLSVQRRVLCATELSVP